MREERTRSHLSAPSANRLRWAVSLLLATMFALLVLFRTGHMWLRYEAALADYQRRAESLSLVLSKHLEQTIAAADTALAKLALQSERIGGPNALSLSWSPVLEAASSGLYGVSSISLINENGLVTQSSRLAAVGESRAEEFLFRRMAKVPTAELIVDLPSRSVVDGKPTIQMGRRLVDSEGFFAGVVVATLEPEYLRNFYRSVDTGLRGVIWLLHPSGIVLLREPSGGIASGDAVPDHPLLMAPLDQDGSGYLRVPLEAGGASYLSAIRTLGKPNLVLAVSLHEGDALAAWYQEALATALIVGGAGILLLIAGLFINWEIRARAEADAALRVNRARFHEIMYHAPTLVSLKDTEGRIMFMNHALERYLGKSLNDVVGKHTREFVSEGAAPLIARLDKEVLAKKSPIQREVSYPSKDGMRTALFVKFPLFDENGNVEAIASFSTDLTEQRRAETRFRTIMDNAPAVIALKDLQGRFIFANREFERLLKKPVSEILGKTVRDLFPADYADAHDAFDHEVIEARAPLQREFLAPYPDGPKTLLFIKFPVFDAKGDIEAIGLIYTDISEQKQIEAQLAKAQRMEAVGQLSGGLAHDFNNLLTVIIGNAEILTEELKNDERLLPLAQVTLDAAERSATLTQRLLAFGRRQMLEPKSTDIRQLVEDMEELIARAVGERIKIEYRYAEGLWPAIIDPSQLETAILNLVVNSRDAMPDGGRIVIELSNVQLDESNAQLNPDTKPGDYIMVAVSDTGSGMPPEVVARVFEPFFTTKEVGKGTGLGLPMIYGFAKQSGGHVKVYSEVGHGTVVRLYIPRAKSPSLVPSLPAEEPDELPGGNETILLVEDDKLVRAHTESQLAGLGYRVVVAANADEALKLAVLTGRPDLLLTDMIMPGKANGRDLAERMRERWPDIRILYTSGYADGALPERLDELSAGMHFLPKPFRRRDLALKVREVLDAPSPAHTAV